MSLAIWNVIALDKPNGEIFRFRNGYTPIALSMRCADGRDGERRGVRPLCCFCTNRREYVLPGILSPMSADTVGSEEVTAMENQGVRCDVSECMYNAQCSKCTLDKIEVTHQKTGENAINTPHFCKSFTEK